MSHSAENTLFPILKHALSILIHRLGFRLSAPNLNTFPTRQPMRIEHSRQPIRNEHFVTRVVSQSESSITSRESSLRLPRALGSGGGPFSALGSSRLAIAHLNTWGTPPPHLISSHSYYCWVNIFWFSFCSVTIFVAIIFVVDDFRNRVDRFSVSVSRTTFCVFSLFFCFFSWLP